MDVEKFVDDFYEAKGLPYPGNYWISLLTGIIKAAIDQDREEREEGLEFKVQDYIKAAPDEWKEAIGEAFTYGYYCKPDPLAAKLERLAEGRDYIKLSWMAKQWRVQAGKHECYADTPLAAVEKALEEVEGKEESDA